jgi:transforming growth factor-beta-induced protein
VKEKWIMNRTMWVLILLILVTLAAAGCTQPTPPATPTPTPTPAATPEPMKNIVEIAVADGRFTTLVAAVGAADLVDTLSGPGPFTVFAPTDDAFAKLPPGTVETLLQDPKGQLTQILLYHVVPGKYMAADVVKETSLMTVQGSPLEVKVDGSTVMVDNATIVITDIEASNGVIHVIDAVMIPP